MDDLENPNEPIVQASRRVIHVAVRILSVLMTLVILWGVADVVWVLYTKLMEPPRFMLTIGDILATFGAFMAVLIAIEIFVNIVIYLREDVIHVKIVLATALMAIARKVIILDYDAVSPEYMWATAGVTLSMSIGYWLVVSLEQKEKLGNGKD
ncbi:phosphate-starvation-inducible PsiE family protein [Desulfuromonas acetoxidans]|uniref:Membrane protein n=1 Tax=Desulfuromonas acetoxidans (strain DSM 684 / 11070) TaxID=281689 RepID=Q1K1E6_DESA6|nr:phosphate-starvation-inducible PsiE family protein [Desulfuromonas acetoxidans]EAT16442.1 membrane protein [Desulfuromonas acetoxidans DSM 684]MBF0644388.1 phosphate-starvation-inducible PsiE family protein [Desulfuromonas acetoxidans]NVD23582.1 phosphate-starvation-inducible PsiE family protein [Desulfuromonas acetoxidans]NVE16033.1 phosphate-starvation-inducible PsiE family protein [Desulfuromonas acetoxidans]